MSEPKSPAPAPDPAGKPPLSQRVLLVEDSEDDVFQFQRMIRRTAVHVQLDVVTDGEMAVRWLTDRLNEARSGLIALPRAVFLDLKLPGLEGWDVLRWVRQQPELDRTLVVVCSWSEDLRDIAEAERLHADLYLTKYPPADQLAALLRVTDRHSLRR